MGKKLAKVKCLLPEICGLENLGSVWAAGGELNPVLDIDTGGTLVTSSFLSSEMIRGLWVGARIISILIPCP